MPTDRPDPSAIADYFAAVAQQCAVEINAWAISPAGRRCKASTIRSADVTIGFAEHDPRDGDTPVCWMVSVPVKVQPRRKASHWMSVRGIGETPEAAASEAVRGFIEHHAGSTQVRAEVTP